ncbi:MAG: hypothetical protein LBK99_08365, partial [Opitutaceae bacterium]|nr:hypothetical protein [Opitutaceae bacterium]
RREDNFVEQEQVFLKNIRVHSRLFAVGSFVWKKEFFKVPTIVPSICGSTNVEFLFRDKLLGCLVVFRLRHSSLY